ncbi:UNVERIFIED_CONTAM: Wound-induced protein 1 [Sesamum calycinum]|uniref:Wound-induced protein 1 n=1 Tax=Sesamum calycinum TaxID=2727403 RepID=A0AAW2RQH2_9LAMI
MAIDSGSAGKGVNFNRGVVKRLYDALNRRDAPAIQQILAPDLEWWFHGPPSHQFLMRLLTGEQDSSFCFLPHSISAFGPTVLAEGFDQSRSIAWVHAWTVTDGVITHVREYFNTSLTVTRFGNTDQSDCSGITSPHCPSVWESSLPDRVGKSVPGLVLAIIELDSSLIYLITYLFLISFALLVLPMGWSWMWDLLPGLDQLFESSV